MYLLLLYYLQWVNNIYIFQNNGKTVQAARFIKSRVMDKVIDSIILIDTFLNKCVLLKGMLQSPRLEYHVKTIVINQ